MHGGRCGAGGGHGGAGAGGPPGSEGQGFQTKKDGTETSNNITNSSAFQKRQRGYHTKVMDASAVLERAVRVAEKAWQRAESTRNNNRLDSDI